MVVSRLSRARAAGGLTLARNSSSAVSSRASSAAGPVSADPIVTGAVGAVDQVLAGVTGAFGGKVADGFGTFAVAAIPYGGDTCAAGLLIRLTSSTCDIHPSQKGAALLASTVYVAERR
jgi:hypothetical protein